MTELLPEHRKPRAQSRTALVTGARRGIGLAIANALRADGITVIALSREDGNLGAFSDTWDLCELVRTRDIDILVNNAGISVGESILSPMAEVEFDQTYTVNVRAPFALARAALPGMIERGYGRIVNIASIYSLVGRANRSAYIVSKCALHGLTLALSAEFAHAGVLTNTVSPGPIDTDMTRNRLTDEDRAEFAQRIPAGRIGSVDEVARLVAWLASDENTYVTGQNIAVDGGFVGV